MTGPGLVPIKPLTPSADTVPYYTGTVTAALATFTSAGRDLVGASTVAIQKATLGLGNVDNTSDATKNAATVALTNKTINADLNTITNIDDNEIKPAAGIQATKIGTGVVDNTEFAYLDGTTSNIQGQINAIVASGAGGPGIVPIAPLTPAANTLPYYTGTTTGAVTPLTAAGRALIDDADTAAMRTTLGLVVGTNVQAYDPTLQSLSALGTVADRIAYTTGTDTWAETPLTATARTLIDDTSTSAMRTTLGLVTPIAIAIGGTGQTTQAAAFVLSCSMLIPVARTPMPTTADITRNSGFAD
jgi:hypothetical protein